MEGLRKTTKILRLADLRAQIWTGKLPITKQKWTDWTAMFDVIVKHEVLIQQNILGLSTASCGRMTSKPTTEMVIETLAYSSFNHMTRLLAWEYFIEFSRRKSFKLYITKFWVIQKWVISLNEMRFS